MGDNATEPRRLSTAEKVLFGLARDHGEPLWSCSNGHPLFMGSGSCPTCGRQGRRVETKKEANDATQPR